MHGLRRQLAELGLIDVHRLTNERVLVEIEQLLERGVLTLVAEADMRTRGGSGSSPWTSSAVDRMIPGQRGDPDPAASPKKSLPPGWWPFEKSRDSSSMPTTSESPVDSTIVDEAAEQRERTDLATALIQTVGSGQAGDIAPVAAELAKLPASILRVLRDKGTSVKVCRDSVTDYMTDLVGVRPRGWPSGMTWDNVPGLYAPDRDEVVIATIADPAGGRRVPASGEGHGSFNLVLHETSHAVDRHARAASNSASEAFRAAYDADLATLDAYESQAGNAGREEAYAEGAARHYGGDPGDRDAHPHLHQFWNGFASGSSGNSD
jgi:hypothetical protein